MKTGARIGLYSDSGIVGGAERSLLNLAAAYRGVAELVICCPVGPVLDEATRLAPGVATHLVRSRRSGAGAVADHRRDFALLELDLLQVTLANPFASRPAILAGFSLRIPTIAVEQLVFPSRRRRGAALKQLLSLPLAAHIAVGSASAVHLQRLFHLRRRRLHVVHNGVAEWSGQPTVHPNRPVIGCAARLEPAKGLEVLLDAMVAIPGARLVLVGDGSCRAALEAQAGALGLADRVEIVGWVADARPHIEGFDVFVLPSREEAFPLTIIEAMLGSTPVVAADVGSVSDAVVDGETGLLVPSGDAKALSQALRRLLSDVELGDRLAAAARRRALQHFTATTMADRYDAIWSDILATSADRR